MKNMFILVKKCKRGLPLQAGNEDLHCSKKKPCPEGYECKDGVCCAEGIAFTIIT